MLGTSVLPGPLPDIQGPTASTFYLLDLREGCGCDWEGLAVQGSGGKMIQVTSFFYAFSPCHSLHEIITHRIIIPALCRELYTHNSLDCHELESLTWQLLLSYKIGRETKGPFLCLTLSEDSADWIPLTSLVGGGL